MKQLIVALLATTTASLSLHADGAPQLNTGSGPNFNSHGIGSSTSLTQNEDLSTLRSFGWMSTVVLGKMELSEAEKEAFLSGVKAGLDGESVNANPRLVQQQVQQFMQQRIQTITLANKAEGKTYLEELATKPGIQKSDTGLLYEIIEEGEGPHATTSDSVRVNYRGTLINGKEFDSSYKRGQSATFPVNGVVKGFGEGVQLVGKGGKVKLYIPSDLGYGDEFNPGSDIPPGSTLIFEVEMIDPKAQ